MSVGNLNCETQRIALEKLCKFSVAFLRSSLSLSVSIIKRILCRNIFIKIILCCEACSRSLFIYLEPMTDTHTTCDFMIVGLGVNRNKSSLSPCAFHHRLAKEMALRVYSTLILSKQKFKESRYLLCIHSYY